MIVRNRVKELLKELIAIKSVSGREGDIQRFIERKLTDRGLSLIRQTVDKGRYNLFYRGSKPFLISCHVDTVPSLGMRDAFNPKEAEGRIYGRGASDVKGAIASLITAIDIYKDKYPGTDVPSSLAFVVDEENNSALGSEKVVELIESERFCLVLEPTYGKLCTSQMGAIEFRLTVKGEGAHGSEFEKVENPVKVCMRMVDRLEDELERPVNVIMVRGGSENYVVPKRCDMLLEVKVFKGEEWESVDGRIRGIVEGFRTSCEVSYRVEDAENYIEFYRNDFTDLLKEIYREVEGKEPAEATMPSWTDAVNYHRAGLPCVVFGYGSLKDSHTERESIGEDELEKMTMFFLKLLECLR